MKMPSAISSYSTIPSSSETYRTYPSIAFAPSSATPASLLTYNRNMHLYTSAQMEQMRAAVSSAAETATSTLDDTRSTPRSHSS